jgi:hypothetical protein
MGIILKTNKIIVYFIKFSYDNPIINKYVNNIIFCSNDNINAKNGFGPSIIPNINNKYQIYMITLNANSFKIIIPILDKVK